MRELITIQKNNKLNNVYAADEKGNGGANHTYLIFCGESDPEIEHVALLQFQNGPRNENNSVYGILDTDLLEIVRDRLQGFQQGEYATRENAIALTRIEEALLWLNKRVEDRAARNVLGTLEE